MKCTYVVRILEAVAGLRLVSAGSVPRYSFALPRPHLRLAIERGGSGRSGNATLLDQEVFNRPPMPWDHPVLRMNETCCQFASPAASGPSRLIATMTIRSASTTYPNVRLRIRSSRRW